MVRVKDIDFYTEKGQVLGMRAKVVYEGKTKELVVKGAVGMTQVLPSAAALVRTTHPRIDQGSSAELVDLVDLEHDGEQT